MTKAEIIKSNIENVNEKYNTSFEVMIVNYKNYDKVLVIKEDDSCFTIKDIISILHNSNLNEWKISLNYGDEGGDFGTNRRMTYIEIYVNKIGTSNRVNLG